MTDQGTEDKGFWDSVKDIFMPEDDRDTFAEGVRRGGYLLTACLAMGRAAAR